MLVEWILQHMGMKKLQMGLTRIEERKHVGCVPKLVEARLHMGKKQYEEPGNRNTKFDCQAILFLREGPEAKHSEVLRSSEHKGEGN